MDDVTFVHNGPMAYFNTGVQFDVYECLAAWLCLQPLWVCQCGELARSLYEAIDSDDRSSSLFHTD